jgi:hypothetical protein
MFWVCFGMQSACAVLYCHLWPAPRHNIFPHYLINGKVFFGGGGGEKLSNTKYVFRFSLQLLSETFLGAFAKSDYQFHVRPSVCLYGTTRLPLDEFHEIWYLNIFRKFVQKIKVSLKSGKNNGYFAWKPIHIFYHTWLNFLRMRTVSDNRCRDDKTHFFVQLFSLSLSKTVLFMRQCGKTLYSRTGHRWQYGARALHAG